MTATALRARALGGEQRLAAGTETVGDTPRTRAGGLAIAALMFLPGALVVFAGFNAGGYFPPTTAVIAMVIAQILLVRVLQASHPFAGVAPSALVAIGALACYALLTLLSALWSHALARALIEFDRAWLYLLILLTFAAIRPSMRNLRRFLGGLLLGIALVCIAGLISRVLPDVWHTAPGVANERLSYPVTYWNTLGLLAALGTVLAFHFSCTLAERRALRVFAAALVPLLAVTLFFTFSRGSMLAGAIGLIVYALVGRPRGLLSGALAIAPPTVVLIVVAYHANLLDTADPTTPAAVVQGHRVALVAGLCVAACAGLRLLLAGTLDPRLRRAAQRRETRARQSSSHSRRRARLAFAAAIVAAAVALTAVAVALGLPHTVAHDWNRFISGASITEGRGDLRQRLADPSNNGRTDLWRVALHGFAAAPLHGSGAGTYQTLWDRERPRYVYTVNAHSLYLQAMAELGLPGLILLLIVIAAVLGGLARRARGGQRSLYGALLALGVVWALHAGVDWDWEMPVVTLGFFAAAGLALSPRGRDRSSASWAPSHGTRLGLALVCLLSIVLPVVIIGSQRRLDEAERTLYASNCTAASSAALASIGWLDVRPEPYEVLGYCDLQLGLPRQGIAAMRQALRLDPNSWEAYYGLALARGAAGLDPRLDAARARQLSPTEPLTRQAARAFAVSSPLEWVKRSATLRAAALASNDLSILPS